MYEVRVEVVTPDYKYYNLLGDTRYPYKTIEECNQAIENAIDQWPNWSEGRKALFRSHCRIVKDISDD